LLALALVSLRRHRFPSPLAHLSRCCFPSPLTPLPVPGEGNRVLPSPLGVQTGDEGVILKEGFRVAAFRTLKSPGEYKEGVAGSNIHLLNLAWK
jgi:hypothetical protein